MNNTTLENRSSRLIHIIKDAGRVCAYVGAVLLALTVPTASALETVAYAILYLGAAVVITSC